MHVAKVREFERILVHNFTPLLAANVRSREKYRFVKYTESRWRS